MASYLQASIHKGEWFVRIEDIDPDREPQGATQAILQTLVDYGFSWTGKPIFQSRHYHLHKHLALRLLQENHAYYCSCSRKQLAKIANIGSMGPIYPGTCAQSQLQEDQLNIRVRTNNKVIQFNDKQYGYISCDLAKQSGDYVIFRADNSPSYIFAVSIDDAFEGYTEVVRGADLLDITARQIHLSTLIKKNQTAFFHIPIITDQDGSKLSKQTYAPALKKHHAKANLYFALQDLGQEPPRHLLHRPICSIWQWAAYNWQAINIPNLKSITYNH